MRKILLFVFLLVFGSQLRASPPGTILHSWSVDMAKKTVTLHLINSTGKDITAYSINIKETYGQHVNEHEFSTDSVGLMLNIQDLAGTADGDNLRKLYGNGTFQSGTNHDEVIHVQPGMTTFDATLEVVIYADKTVETTNPEALNRALSSRKAYADTLQAANQVIQKALANPNDPNPHQTAAQQIEQLQSGWANKNHSANFNAGAFQEVLTDLQYAPTASKAAGKSVREYLNDYIAKKNQRATALLDHAKLGGAQ